MSLVNKQRTLRNQIISTISRLTFYYSIYQIKRSLKVVLTAHNLDSMSNGTPWFFAKGQDNFLPISRFIDKRDVRDPHNLELTLHINGQQKQQDNTGNMYFKIDDQLEYITRYVTLNPGDLILTGTPGGMGPIEIGDKLHATLKQDDKLLVEMKYDVIKDNLI
jgi:acylpyruvate hydrolase